MDQIKSLLCPTSSDVSVRVKGFTVVYKAHLTIRVTSSPTVLLSRTLSHTTSLLGMPPDHDF